MTTVIGSQRSGMARSLARSLLMMGMLCVLLSVIQIAVLPLSAPDVWISLVFAAAFLSYVGAGMLAWYRRPSNRMGSLILVCGLGVYAVGFGGASSPVLAFVGSLAGSIPLATAIHLLHAFPTGRLRGPLSVVTVATGYAASTVFQLPAVLLPASAEPVAIARFIQAILGLLVFAMTAAILLGRLRAATQRGLRRVLVPLYAYGIAAVVLIKLAASIRSLTTISPVAIGLVQLALLAGVPIAFVLAVLRGGFARTGEIEELGGWLGALPSERGTLRDALARTLGDPSIRIYFWLDDGGIYADSQGLPAPVTNGPGRGVVDVTRDQRPIARIEYDDEAVVERWLVASAGNVVAIALDGERLTAQLRASRNELRESRERLVDVGERERRQIARDLHDGLQMRLVSLAITSQRIAGMAGIPPTIRDACVDLRRSIDDAAADLRQLVNQVQPPGLIEGGLPAALEDLSDRFPLPVELELDLPQESLAVSIQSTSYFVVSEALTNVLKHAGASTARVLVRARGGSLRIEVSDDGLGGASPSDGSGLRGLADRLDVVGGTLRIHSPIGEGTDVIAEMPCES